ncbi:MAG: TRAP transporter small permease subunit [Gammaproteobacteria bacterium]|nr:TRAP transporter small permease subunit [Gammaproteobacteria bacterium]MCP5424076.1 TRAP transporter small permease subunit [Gammaproteobacteria bacterium]MCP5459471.1 TRAP transporter small permease subunit [Gammaproteobacteria bacterium]
MLKLARAIDTVNEYVGTFNAFLIIPLLVVVVFEVIMRYGFNAPTTWAFETTTFLYGIHFVLAFGYTHKHDGHVAIDVFVMRLSDKPRAVMRIITNILLFIPTTGLLAIWSVKYAAISWSQWEVNSTSWAPPLYPLKTIMAIGFVLLFLQGIAKLIQDFHILQGNDPITER